MIDRPDEPKGEGSGGSAGDDPAPLCGWTARNVRPVVLVYLTAVFAAFIALALFVFHSVEAVKALATTLIASLVALLANVLAKTEYQLTESGLRKRTLNPGKPKAFKEVFSWGEVACVIPNQHGFKYYRAIEDANPLLRFWKAHLSASFSGEVHVEQADQEKVMGHLARRNIPTSKPIRPLGKGPDEIPGRAPGEPGAR